ncbi:MAG: potassium channel protein [Desulfovibrio sp.]|jgi:voltage-gated potassium channel|nr:potassium channel protein [Desulfovibrio sp.]
MARAQLPDFLRGGTFKLAAAICALLFVSSTGIYLVENRTVVPGYFEALWWSVVTMTTVGYGDIVPATTGGKVLGLMVMAGGIGLVSTLTGNLASLLVERKAKKRKGLLEVKQSGHVVVLGWNSSVPGLVRGLKENGLLDAGGLVLVTDLPEERREEVAFQLELGPRLSFVAGKIAQENVVHKSRPDNASLVYILRQDNLPPHESDQQSIYAALTVRGMSPKVPIYAEAAQPENRVHLLRAGVTELIDRGEISSGVLALLGAAPQAWNLLQAMLGLRGRPGISLRALSEEEKAGTWSELVSRQRQQDGSQPLALCQTARSLALEDILDAGSALDQFILELFQSHGRETKLGSREAALLVNPADAQALAAYDGVLLLRQGGGGQP